MAYSNENIDLSSSIWRNSLYGTPHDLEFNVNGGTAPLSFVERAKSKIVSSVLCTSTTGRKMLRKLMGRDAARLSVMLEALVERMQDRATAKRTSSYAFKFAIRTSPLFRMDSLGEQIDCVKKANTLCLTLLLRELQEKPRKRNVRGVKVVIDEVFSSLFAFLAPYIGEGGSTEKHLQFLQRILASQEFISFVLRDEENDQMCQEALICFQNLDRDGYLGVVETANISYVLTRLKWSVSELEMLVENPDIDAFIDHDSISTLLWNWVLDDDDTIRRELHTYLLGFYAACQEYSRVSTHGVLPSRANAIREKYLTNEARLSLLKYSPDSLARFEGVFARNRIDAEAEAEAETETETETGLLSDAGEEVGCPVPVVGGKAPGVTSHGPQSPSEKDGEMKSDIVQTPQTPRPLLRTLFDQLKAEILPALHDMFQLYLQSADFERLTGCLCALKDKRNRLQAAGRSRQSSVSDEGSTRSQDDLSEGMQVVPQDIYLQPDRE
jgi:hypothetical protein